MANDLATRLKGKQYEQAIVDYLHNRGHFLCATDDSQFATLLRTTLLKQLGQGPDSLTSTSDPDQILRFIRDISARKAMPLVLLERSMAGRDMGFMVRQIKNAFTELRIIILTGETERQRLVLLHEIGADNFITKPISIDGLIEKIAFTIKPQGKLGQLIDLARSMITQNNPQQALKICKQILELKANSAAGFLVIGDAFKALGKLDRAREAYEEASNNSEMYLEPLRKLAELYEELHDIPKRLYYLERLDQLSPLNVERKVDMGEIHLILGNDEAAGKLFDSAVTLATKEAVSYIGEVASRVAAIYAEKDPAQSEKFLRRALEAKGQYLSKDDIATFNRLGILLRNQGKWREALVEYQKAIRIIPDDENLYYNMGMACAEGREFREAHVYMLKALAINANFPRSAVTIAYNIGLVFYQAGGKEKARECLTIALELNPQYEPARKALAHLH
ncbi:MAG: tetratricopeptide repeat protein [Desulfovibrionaceae bacterium]